MHTHPLAADCSRDTDQPADGSGGGCDTDRPADCSGCDTYQPSDRCGGGCDTYPPTTHTR